MNIDFRWEENESSTGEGTATFFLGSTKYVLKFPSLKKALEIEKMLQEVFLEGRMLGQKEVKSAFLASFEDVQRKTISPF
jgi:hypothetical protein